MKGTEVKTCSLICSSPLTRANEHITLAPDRLDHAVKIGGFSSLLGRTSIPLNF